MHGSLIYLLLGDQENQPQNKVPVAGLTGNWMARMYIAPLAPPPDGMPEYHYVLALSGPVGTRNLLIAYPRAAAIEAGLFSDPNGWLCFSSSDQGWQEWTTLTAKNGAKQLQLGFLSHARSEADVAITVTLGFDAKTYSLVPSK